MTFQWVFIVLWLLHWGFSFWSVLTGLVYKKSTWRIWQGWNRGTCLKMWIASMTSSPGADICYDTSCNKGCNIGGHFYCLSRKCSCLYVNKRKCFLSDKNHTVVVVDFLKMVFCGFGAVGGGTVRGLRGGKLLLWLTPSPPFSRGRDGSGGGGGRGGQWWGSFSSLWMGSPCRCTSLFFMS